MAALEMFMFDNPSFDSRQASPVPSALYWFDDNSFDVSRSSTPGFQSEPWLDNFLFHSRESSPASQSLYCLSPDGFGSPYRRPRHRTRRRLQRSITGRTSFTEKDLEQHNSLALPSRNLVDEIDQDAKMLLLRELRRDIPSNPFESRESSPALSLSYNPSPELGNPYPQSRSGNYQRKPLHRPISTNLPLPSKDDLVMLSPSPIRTLGGFDKDGNNLFLQHLTNAPQLLGPFGPVQQRKADLSGLCGEFDTSDMMIPTQAAFKESNTTTQPVASNTEDFSAIPTLVGMKDTSATDPNLAFLESVASEFTEKVKNTTETNNLAPSCVFVCGTGDRIPELNDFLPDPFASILNFNTSETQSNLPESFSTNDNPQTVDDNAALGKNFDIFTTNAHHLPQNSTVPEFSSPIPPPRSKSTFASLPHNRPRAQPTRSRRSAPAPRLDRTSTDPSLHFLEFLSHPPYTPSYTPSSHRRARSAAATSTPSTHLLSHRSSGLSFVNFTPNDGDTLLSGVAPSGSGKTKMKREKEAEETRERIKEMARRAIEEVGGDVAVLERIGV